MADRHPQRRRPAWCPRRTAGLGVGGGRLSAARGSGDRRGTRRSRGGLHFVPAHDPGPDPAPRTVQPVRTCVGCRNRSVADGLMRVVVVDGVLTPDPRRRLPGRGAWLHPDPECLHRAERRSAFPRALRVPGKLDAAALWSYIDRGAT